MQDRPRVYRREGETVFDTLYTQVGAVLMVAVGAFAFLKGDEPERIGAGAYLLAWFASLVVQGDFSFYDAPWALFGIDVVILGVFCGLSWKSRHAWPLWAAALQLLPVMGHIMMRVDLRPPASAFYAVMNLASIGILVALGVGTFWAWQERRAAGLE